jgi:hypothetical protein
VAGVSLGESVRECRTGNMRTSIVIVSLSRSLSLSFSLSFLSPGAGVEPDTDGSAGGAGAAAGVAAGAAAAAAAGSGAGVSGDSVAMVVSLSASTNLAVDTSLRRAASLLREGMVAGGISMRGSPVEKEGDRESVWMVLSPVVSNKTPIARGCKPAKRTRVAATCREAVNWAGCGEEREGQNCGASRCKSTRKLVRGWGSLRTDDSQGLRDMYL